MKDFLNRFGAFVVKLQNQDEALMVHAFGQGILSGPFNDSLIRNRARMFGEIRRRVVAHIVAEEVVTVKRGRTYLGDVSSHKHKHFQHLNTTIYLKEDNNSRNKSILKQ